MTENREHEERQEMDGIDCGCPAGVPTGHDPGDEDRSAERYCENCGDPYDMPPPGDPTFARTFLTWRHCPYPSPGRPLVDCGIGGHMYVEREPRCS